MSSSKITPDESIVVVDDGGKVLHERVGVHVREAEQEDDRVLRLALAVGDQSRTAWKSVFKDAFVQT